MRGVLASRRLEPAALWRSAQIAPTGRGVVIRAGCCRLVAVDEPRDGRILSKVSGTSLLLDLMRKPAEELNERK